MNYLEWWPSLKVLYWEMLEVTIFMFLMDLLLAPPPCADVALEREVEGDLLVGDMGQGLPFRPGAFDGCIRFEGQYTKKCIFWFLCLSLTLYFIYLLKASLPCSGSAMQTRGHTVLPIDCTPSSVLYTLLWWGFVCLHDFFVQLKKKKS